MRPPRSLLLPAVALGVLAGPPTVADAARATECQRPRTTGVVVFDRERVTARAACKVALKLYRWEFRKGNERRLYRCRGFKPILRRRTFAGWRLSIVDTYELRLQRGRRSFRTGGTDFPLNCS